MNMNKCESEGCERRNCSYGDCIDDHDHDADCVVKCRNEECEKEMCLDCRLKEGKKDWDKSCTGCTKLIAPHLAREVERLRELCRTLKTVE